MTIMHGSPEFDINRAHMQDWIAEFKAHLKRSKTTIKELAGTLGKSPGFIGQCLNGGYTFKDAWDLPKYLEMYAVNTYGMPRTGYGP